jgi:hypothetical protein
MKHSGKYSRSVTPVSGDGRHIWPVVSRAYGQTEPAAFNTRAVQSKADARNNNNNLVDECKDFADAFGDHSAYVGWAWMMNPGVSQPLMSEFLLELKYRPVDRFTPSVAYAFESFRNNKINAAAYSSPEKKEQVVNTVRLLKIYGYEALQNKIDLTGEIAK